MSRPGWLEDLGTIGRRLLLIVCIPVFVQLVLTLMTMPFIDHLIQVAETQFRSKELISRSNWLGFTTSGSGLMWIAATLTADDTYKRIYGDLRTLRDSEYKQFLQLLESQPEQKENLQALTRIVTSFCSSLDKIDERNDLSGEAKVEAFVRSPGFYNFWTTFPSVRRNALLIERTDHVVGPMTLPEKRQWFTMVVGCGMLINLITAAAVALIAISLALRLKVVTENARRLAKDQPLLEPVGGHDDVALLDETFHSMAGALKEATERRQELLNMVSHDIRTPLATVQASLEILADRIAITSGAQDASLEIIERAANNCTRILSLTKDLLDIQKIESGMFNLEKTSVEIEALFEEAIDTVAGMAAKKNVKLQYEAHNLSCFGDAPRLVQVLTNLLSNAIKFSPENSIVNINAAERVDFIEIEVVDRGRGLPPGMTEAVFDRFRQVEAKDSSERKGTGLGLAIAKAIVELHGGKIACRSEPGKGSTFYFTVPRA